MPVSLIKGSSREYWFILTTESISWFKDEEVSSPLSQLHSTFLPLWFPTIHFLSVFLQEKEQKFVLRTDEMRFRDIEASRFSIGKKHGFALYYTNSK